MKKLNITKEAFNKSKYFQNKYGKLEYVSESGKVYKTDKGNLIKFIGESKEITIRDIVHKHKRGLEQALNTLVGLREDIKNHFGEDSIYFVQVNGMISDFQDALYDGDDEEMQFDESKKSLLKDVDESIMSAKKVRSMKKGKQINYKVYRDGMKRIENDIKSAAEDGDTSMYWNIFEELEWPFVGDSPEFDMCIKELKQAGYKVELGDFDEDYQRLTVSWDE